MLDPTCLVIYKTKWFKGVLNYTRLIISDIEKPEVVYIITDKYNNLSYWFDWNDRDKWWYNILKLKEGFDTKDEFSKTTEYINKEYNENRHDKA